MDTLGQSELRMNIKHYFDEVSKGYSYLVPRKGDNNVVIISESEYMRLNAYKERLKQFMCIDDSRRESFPTSDELEEMCGSKWQGLYECMCISDGDDTLVRVEQLSYEEGVSL